MLKQILQELQSKSIDISLIPNILRAAGCAKEIIEFGEKEANYVCGFLEELDINSTPEALEKIVRGFLSERWELIRNSPVEYAAFPHSPVNQLCIQIAKAIAKPDESIAQILMPTLVITDYSTQDSLIEMTEKERELDLTGIIVSEDGKAVIPIMDWFRYHSHPGVDKFVHLYTDQSRKNIPLSDIDQQNLSVCARPVSEEFFTLLDIRKKRLSAPGTLSAATLKLCAELFRHGKNGKGTADKADDGVFEHIREYSSVLAKLTTTQKAALFALRGNDPTYQEPFEHYWNIISAENPQTRQRFEAEDNKTCLNNNGIAIKSIVDANPNFFEKIKIANLPSTTEPAENATDQIMEFNGLSEITKIINLRQIGIQEFNQEQDSKNKIKKGESALKLYHTNPDTYEGKLKHYESSLSKSLFIFSIRFNLTEIVMEMLEENPSYLNTTGKDGHSLLYLAAKFKNNEMVELLIGKGARIHDNEYHQIFEWVRKDRPLYTIHLIKSGIKLPVKIDGKDFFIWCIQINSDFAFALLENNASVIEQNTLQEGLFEAMVCDKPDIFLIANILERIQDKNSPIVIKAFKVCKAMLNKVTYPSMDLLLSVFIRRGVNVEHILTDSISDFLFSLAEKNNGNTIFALYEIGLFNINATDKEGKSLIYYAIKNQNENFLRFLFKNGADKNKKISLDGEGALDAAIKENCTMVYVILDPETGPLEQSKIDSGFKKLLDYFYVLFSKGHQFEFKHFESLLSFLKVGAKLSLDQRTANKDFIEYFIKQLAKQFLLLLHDNDANIYKDFMIRLIIESSKINQPGIFSDNKQYDLLECAALANYSDIFVVLLDELSKLEHKDPLINNFLACELQKALIATITYKKSNIYNTIMLILINHPGPIGFRLNNELLTTLINNINILLTFDAFSQITVALFKHMAPDVPIVDFLKVFTNAEIDVCSVIFILINSKKRINIAEDQRFFNSLLTTLSKKVRSRDDAMAILKLTRDGAQINKENIKDIISIFDEHQCVFEFEGLKNNINLPIFFQKLTFDRVYKLFPYWVATAKNLVSLYGAYVAHNLPENSRDKMLLLGALSLNNSHEIISLLENITSSSLFGFRESYWSARPKQLEYITKASVTEPEPIAENLGAAPEPVVQVRAEDEAGPAPAAHWERALLDLGMH